MSKTTIASVDGGNGGTNGVIAMANGRTKQFYTPSVRAIARGDTLGLKGMELEYQYVDWNGFRYVVGDDVTRITRRGIERHLGGDRYGNEFHQFLVAVALANLGVKSGDVDLTLFAPPGLYNQVRGNILKNFDTPVEIRLKGDKKPRNWEYSKVTVLPESVAGMLTVALDKKGQPTATDMLTGEIVVLDGGAKTFDAVVIRNGNINPESLEESTWSDGGLDLHVRQPILRYMQGQGMDFDNLTVDDIDRVIRAGLVTDDYTLIHAGKEVDIKPVVDKYALRYAEWVANNIIDGVYNGLNGYKSGVVIGGWVALVKDHIKEWYGDKIVFTDVDAVDANAHGGLRYRLSRLK